MSKIKRNDPCYCGSGKKYKKCHMLIDNKPSIEIWEENLNRLQTSDTSNLASQSVIKDVYFELLKIVKRDAWTGACHATTSVLYVLLKELGCNVKIKVGEVRSADIPKPFDHSWIEIEGEIYDIAIAFNLGGYHAAPIFKSKNLETLERTIDDYGIMVAGLGSEAKLALKMDLTSYMDGFPLSKEGLWSYVQEVARNAQVTIETNENLREKYMTVYREKV